MWPVAKPRRRSSLGAALMLLLALTSCAKPGGDQAMQRLRDEPIFRPPPAVTQLHRSSRNPEGGGIVGVEQSGTIEVIWGSEAEPNSLRDHYMQAHGPRYQLHEESAGYVRLAGLGPEIDGWRAAYSVYIQSDPPDELVGKPGGGPSQEVRTYVVVSGSVS